MVPYMAFKRYGELQAVGNMTPTRTDHNRTDYLGRAFKGSHA